ncbi:MAG: hypothetical protein AB8G11_24570 [Saprospiraceae bacterium]
MRIDLDFKDCELNGYSIESFEIDGKKYQKLLKGDFLIMDNTPQLVETYKTFLLKAEGSVLINGLGMGLCCKYLLSKSSITDITVVELDKGTIDIVQPNFSDERLTIIHDSAFDYQPPEEKVYDYVWHDIWFYYTSKNLKDMNILFEKYNKIAKWQGAWNRDKCMELQQKEINFSLK